MKQFKFEDLPKKYHLYDTAITYLGYNKSSDLTLDYHFMFESGRFKSVEYLRLPIVHDDGRVWINRNWYVPIIWVTRPIITMQNRGEFRQVTLHNVLTGYEKCNYDMVFRVRKATGAIYVIYLDNYYERIPNDIKKRFWITEDDRQQLNKYLHVEKGPKELHLTVQDLIKIEKFFLEDSMDSFDWKDVEEMRACTLEDMIIATMMHSFYYAFRTYKLNGKSNWGMITRQIDRYISTAPQMQIDQEHTEIGRLALKQKIQLPIGAFEDLEEVAADPSWFYYIDQLTTPQSSKAGATVSLCGGVSIKNRRIVRENEN